MFLRAPVVVAVAVLGFRLTPSPTASPTDFYPVITLQVPLLLSMPSVYVLLLWSSWQVIGLCGSEPSR